MHINSCGIMSRYEKVVVAMSDQISEYDTRVPVLWIKILKYVAICPKG